MIFFYYYDTYIALLFARRFNFFHKIDSRKVELSEKTCIRRSKKRGESEKVNRGPDGARYVIHPRKHMGPIVYPEGLTPPPLSLPRRAARFYHRRRDTSRDTLAFIDPYTMFLLWKGARREV